jgi:adenylylsulfate kinase-like enzyme
MTAPAREVVLLAGPPGAGKTTRARVLCESRGLTLFDRDETQWQTDRQFRAALADLGRDRTARAVVIRACASRSAWSQAVSLVGATSTELLTPGEEVCRGRIARDTARVYAQGTWRGRAARLAGVTAWHRDHAADPWSPPRRVLAPSREW